MKKFLSKLFSYRFSKLVAVLLVLCIVAVSVLGNKSVQNKLFGKKATVTQRTTTVQKGNIQETVTGSGSVYFTNDKILYSKIGATVTKVNYNEGDTVKAGDVIAEFDSSDFKDTLETNLLNLQQAQLSVQNDKTSLANLSISAPISGTVTGLSLQNGDSVQTGSTVCTISNTSLLQVGLTFNAADTAKIRVGQSATVYLSSTMQTVAGTVASVNNTSSATSQGGLVYSVTIHVPNPGAIVSGATASADISTGSGTVSSTNTAALSYAQSQKVIAQAGGTVQSLGISNGQSVSAGTVLCTLKSDTLTQTLQSDQIKLTSLQNQYNQSLEQLDDYKVTAPFAGTLTAVKYKVGDTVTAGSEIAEVADPSSVEFDVDVDELDISKLSVGQAATVTLDALTDTTTTPLTAKVAKIAVTGTSSEGVTSYPVTVQILNGLSKIKGGMNANATITVKDLKNVLYVPIEAVTTQNSKSYVWVKESGSSGGGMPSGGAVSGASGSMPDGAPSGAPSGEGYGRGSRRSGSSGSYSRSGSSGDSSYYAGAVRREVTLGDSNDTNIEVKSGLSEGDIVILPKLTTAVKTTSTTSSRSAFGGSGAAGGGMGGGAGGGFR